MIINEITEAARADPKALLLRGPVVAPRGPREGARSAMISTEEMITPVKKEAKPGSPTI